MMTTPAPDPAAYLREFAALEQPAMAMAQPADPVEGAQTYFKKMQNFEKSHPEVVYVPPEICRYCSRRSRALKECSPL